MPKWTSSVCLTGLHTVMGFDQDHIDRIFLPGQADLHYQHLARSTGTVRVGDRSWQIHDAGGGKDHSWGVRNWHAKIYLRWLIASIDDDNGFLLVRAVGPTKQTRSGFVLEDGEFHLVDDFEMSNDFGGSPHFELRRTQSFASAAATRPGMAKARPQAWLPLRHRQKNAKGEEAVLRIVKSPSDWTFDDGRRGEGHVRVPRSDRRRRRPVGLHD